MSDKVTNTNHLLPGRPAERRDDDQHLYLRGRRHARAACDQAAAGELEGRWSGDGATRWIRRTFHPARAERGCCEIQIRGRRGVSCKADDFFIASPPQKKRPGELRASMHRADEGLII